MISKWLNEIKQYPRLKLFFNDRAVSLKSEFSKTVKEKGTIKILQLRTFPVDEPYHALTVYAVPSSQRYYVRQQFEQIIIPKLLDYLGKKDFDENSYISFESFLELKTGNMSF